MHERLEARYQRHLALPEIGSAGQRRLARAEVVVVGCGALGSTQAELLARAGVGTLRLVDADVVELGNLPRQALYTEDDVARRRPKVEAAASHLRSINSAITVVAIQECLTPSNAADLVGGADLALDGLDTFAARFVLNDACADLAIPWVHGGVVGTSGQVLTVLPSRGPCLRCVMPQPPPPGSGPCPERDGLLNTVPRLVGALQATEGLRLLLGAAPPEPALLLVDLWRGYLERLPVAPDPGCPTCSLPRPAP